MNHKIRWIAVVVVTATTLLSFPPRPLGQAQAQGQLRPTHAGLVHASLMRARAGDVQLHLTPSSAVLAGCMPNAQVDVTVKLTTDKSGFDVFNIQAKGLPPNTSFTTFLLQFAASPFGAAEYIGDFTSNSAGNAQNTFMLIVQEAFASTIVNGARVRVDLNQVGAWFADPAGDDFCFGQNGGATTPFDGDNEAGVQAFNSANTTALPPP